LGTRSFVHHGIVSVVNREELVSDRMSFIVLRGFWCNIIIVNLQAPSEEKSGDLKVNFYEELEQVFSHFHKYHMKILLGDFNANVWREIFSNQQLRMRVTVRIVIIIMLVYFVTSKNLVMSTMFQH
jgi:hypothetical protein